MSSTYKGLFSMLFVLMHVVVPSSELSQLDALQLSGFCIVVLSDVPVKGQYLWWLLYCSCGVCDPVFADCRAIALLCNVAIYACDLYT